MPLSIMVFGEAASVLDYAYIFSKEGLSDIEFTTFPSSNVTNSQGNCFSNILIFYEKGDEKLVSKAIEIIRRQIGFKWGMKTVCMSQFFPSKNHEPGNEK